MKMKREKHAKTTSMYVKIICQLNPQDQRIIYFSVIQLAWSRSYAVGCGVFRCEELAGAEDANENALYLVCYYGPGYVSKILRSLFCSWAGNHQY